MSLKQIVTKAKTLYKTGKYKKWTDAIKAASKMITPGIKKKTAKKKAKAKKVGAVKKSMPKKKAATSTHKDNKSHNVRISVVSGLGSVMDHYKTKFGALSTKKLMEKTKRGKNKIAKEMKDCAAKIRKLKQFLNK